MWAAVTISVSQGIC